MLIQLRVHLQPKLCTFLFLLWGNIVGIALVAWVPMVIIGHQVVLMRMVTGLIFYSSIVVMLL